MYYKELGNIDILSIEPDCTIYSALDGHVLFKAYGDETLEEAADRMLKRILNRSKRKQD